MDKRTLLAFLVIFLILVGQSVLMKKLRGDEPPPAAPGNEQMAGPEDGAVTDEPSASATTRPEPAPGDTERAAAQPSVPSQVEDEGLILSAAQALHLMDQDGMPRSVVVTTPHYRVIFSTRGARITSFELAEHQLADGSPVDLIPGGDKAPAGGADLIVFEGATLPLGDAVFTTDAPAEQTLAEGSGPRRVTFSVRTQGGLAVRKTYMLRADGFGLGAELRVVVDDAGLAVDTQRLAGRPDRAIFGWNQGIAATERNQRTTAPAYRSFAKVGEELHFKKRTSLNKGAEKVEGLYTGSVRFAGVQNKYFTVVGIVPPTAGGASEGRAGLGGDQVRMEQTWALDVPLRRQALESGALAGAGIELFIGPQDSELLAAYGVGLEDTLELGWALFRPFAQAVLWIMKQMARVIPNYGVIIILFSVLTKLAFYPLTRKSTQSMKRMQELQPKIKALQEKYKENREKQSAAMMKLYKEEKINPMAGCLPLLIQMPVFVALYQGLMHTIELRQKPFVGWITDLSQPDALFTMPFSLPFMGSDFNLLPILMSAAMWVQTKLTPTGAAGGQMALMNTLMPVMMLVFFYQMPSGLVIYWLVNTLMTIYQTWRIHKTASPMGSVKTA